MNRFTPGNTVELLRSGKEFFPALIEAIDHAMVEVWLETYIFADDAVGRLVAAALIRAARRGAEVRVLVDGWGARHYMTRVLEDMMRRGGVRLMKYRPEIAPWQFRVNRMRRLHRKLCHVDREIAFVGGINIIDDMNTPGHRPPRVDYAVRVRGPVVGSVVQTMQRLWALAELVQFETSDVPLFPESIAVEPQGAQTAKFVIRDNLRYRGAIERTYLAAIRTARSEIIIATAYFFPGVRFRHALIAAAGRGVRVTLILQARVEYRLLRYAAQALYGQLLVAGVTIEEYHRSFLHAKVAVVDAQWATVGSSNIDPYSLLMAREANIFIRDAQFADQLRLELLNLIATGTHRVDPKRWIGRSMPAKAVAWLAYGVVRLGMGLMGYAGNDWFPGRPPRDE